MLPMNDILVDEHDNATEFVTPPPKSAYLDLSSPNAPIAVRVPQVFIWTTTRPLQMIKNELKLLKTMRKAALFSKQQVISARNIIQETTSQEVSDDSLQQW